MRKLNDHILNNEQGKYSWKIKSIEYWLEKAKKVKMNSLKFTINKIICIYIYIHMHITFIYINVGRLIDITLLYS